MERGYAIDLVMCIDATGSMYGIIDKVKENALKVFEKVKSFMADEDKIVRQLRVKLIAFRDYGVDEEPMTESRFFNVTQGESDESAAFAAFVNGIEAKGGGDIPENALEALAFAMKSDWTHKGSLARHVIMLFTDAPALRLGERKDCPGYPSDMPADFDELREWWEEKVMDRRAKRLYVFAPEAEPWTEIAEWSNALHKPSRAGVGCNDVDFDACLILMSTTC